MLRQFARRTYFRHFGKLFEGFSVCKVDKTVVFGTAFPTFTLILSNFELSSSALLHEFILELHLDDCGRGHLADHLFEVLLIRFFRKGVVGRVVLLPLEGSGGIGELAAASEIAGEVVPGLLDSTESSLVAGELVVRSVDGADGLGGWIEWGVLSMMGVKDIRRRILGFVFMRMYV